MNETTQWCKNSDAINKTLAEVRGKLPKNISISPPPGTVRTITGRIVAVLYVTGLIIGAIACLPALILLFVPQVRLALIGVLEFLLHGFGSETAREAQKSVAKIYESLTALGNNKITAEEFLSEFENILIENWILHYTFKQNECIDFNQAVSILLNVDSKDLLRQSGSLWRYLFITECQQGVNANNIYKLATGMRDEGKGTNLHLAIAFIVNWVKDAYFFYAHPDECRLCGLFFLQCLLGSEENEPNWEGFLAQRYAIDEPFVNGQIDGAIAELKKGQWPEDFNLLPPKSTV
jgi:hypothetical protein